VRDEIVQEALRRLAAEAATRLTSLVATGEELPFDVAENEGEHTFYRYVPLTARFVRDHADELRSLPAFVPACSAVDQSGVASAYLEARGDDVPADGVERAEQMLISFIARLWDGSTEFTLERPRLEAALNELRAEVRELSEAEVLVAPLVGLQMPLPRLELPGGVSIVRADTVDAPTEATRSLGMERNAWEPQFLAVSEKEEGPGGAAPAVRVLRELISVLRLFKEGGVGLGPYAYTPTGEGNWKRIPTGTPATRRGGYKLSDAEARELAQFADGLESRPDPDGSLAWAVERFEMGCDRASALEGLSDYLLAMRALFEGQGPVGASLPMRAAALIAEPAERTEAREKLQSAFELEAAMMAGREFDLGSATGLATWLEDAARSIVRGAALGEHGSDVAASADETLVAAGLRAGEGSVAEAAEIEDWDPMDSDEPEPDDEPPEPDDSPEPHPEPAGPRDWHRRPDFDITRPSDGSSPSDGFEPRVGPDDQIRIREGNRSPDSEETSEHRAEPEPITDEGFQDGLYYEDAGGEEEGGSAGSEDHDHDEEETTVRASAERDWLSEVSEAEGGETLEWPVPAGEVSKQRAEWRQDEDSEPLDTPRVRHLFPVPDDTDWDVSELNYDRSRTRVS
jgi:hypothetical protein